MERKSLCLLLVLAMVMALLAGCGGNNDASKNDVAATVTQADNDGDTANPSQAGTEVQDSQELATAIIADAFGEKEVAIAYNTANCEEQSNDGYFVSIFAFEDDAFFDIEFYADYYADQYYDEQVSSFASMGLIASDLENYTSDDTSIYGFDFIDEASGEMYSYQLLVEIDGGILVVHDPFMDMAHEEYAKLFAEKVFVSANAAQIDAVSNNDETNAGNNLALTNEDKENVYKAEYEAIKDQIVKEDADDDEVSYYDTDGHLIMYVEYDDGNIETVFFYEYYDTGEKKFSRIFSFGENGEYGVMDLEFHENGNKKTETVYNTDGSKLVFSFDESGDYVSGAEYDKNGNVVE